MSHAGDHDRELAARIAGGEDRRAEAELYQVLVVTIRALRQGRVAEIDRLAAWVLGVCHNIARDWKKGERRRADLLESLRRRFLGHDRGAAAR